MSAIHVLRPGMLTTVQDSGRWGMQAAGVPVAGPMDPFSHRLANALVGNAREAATLEVTLIGPELRFDDDRTVAVAGAQFEITIDGKPADVGAPFVVTAGSTVRFGPRHHGARAYLAVAGGIATLPVLGSRATHVLSGMGGHEGRPLKAGDVLPLGAATSGRPDEHGVGAGRSAGPAGGEHGVGAGRSAGPVFLVRVLPGPQIDAFVESALDALQSAPYVVAQNSDRMGFRLEGPVLHHRGGAETISDATPLGVLQVPSSGQPILLMADRQTAGGYPKIATVITADLAVAGQLGPGDRLQFVVCSTRDALAALIAQERSIMAVESAS